MPSAPVANARGNIYYSKISGTIDYLTTNADPEFDEQVISGITSSEFYAPRLETGPAYNQRIARLTADLGAEKVTNGAFTGNATGWTLDAVRWAYGTNNVSKIAGGVGQFEQSVSAVATETYRVEYTASGMTAGTVQVSIGGTSGKIINYNGNIVEYLTAVSTANLIFTATSDAVLTIDNVLVNKVVKGIIGSKSISSNNLSAKDAITIWLRSSVDVTSGELQLLLDDTANCASPIETLTLPSLKADTWHRIICKLNTPEDDTAIISIGINRVITLSGSNLGNFTLDIYQPRLMDEFEGRKAFSITRNIEEIDGTDYQSISNREYEPSFGTWTATMEGHKEGAPPLIKSQKYVFGFAESDTVGQCFVGEGNYSGFTPSANFTDLVQYPYTIQGVGFLHEPQN